MNEIWRERNVRRPPLNIVGHKFPNDPANDLELVSQSISLWQPMGAAISRLQQAAAMASRLIARRANSFRVQPSFSQFRKMNVALCRLQELNVSSEIDGMKIAIKSSCQIRDAYHLPTKANFRYFLIRLQSYTKLLMRIVVCAKESHRLFLEILRRSAFVEIITMFMAVTAQIWTECIAICQSAVQLYDAFVKFFKKYFVVQVHEDLPDCLSEWLGDEWSKHIAVKTQFNANKTQKYRNNIILFNAFDPTPAKQLPTIDSDTVDGVVDASMEHKPSMPTFTPKLIINTGMRSINLTDPSKLNRAQQHAAKQHKQVEKKVLREIRVARKQDKKRQMLVRSESSSMLWGNVSTLDMGEKIDRDTFQMQKKIVKMDTLEKKFS